MESNIICSVRTRKIAAVWNIGLQLDPWWYTIYALEWLSANLQVATFENERLVSVSKSNPPSPKSISLIKQAVKAAYLFSYRLTRRPRTQIVLAPQYKTKPHRQSSHLPGLLWKSLIALFGTLHPVYGMNSPLNFASLISLLHFHILSRAVQMGLKT